MKKHSSQKQTISWMEARNSLAVIVESSNDAIVGKTLDGIITTWNKAAERLFGYPAAEAIGKHITLIVPPDLFDEEKEIIRKLKKGQRVEHFETTRVRKDGKKIQVSLSISPIKDDEGNIIGASKIARDITFKKQSEDALRESEERLRLALNAGKIGVWDWNIEQGNLMWTDHVYTIHGVTKGNFNVSFENFRNLIHPDDREEVVHAVDESLSNNRPFSLDFRIVTPDGTTRWVSTSATLSYDSNGKAVRMLGATSDITRQKQLDQEKNDFLSLASHELKTPVTSMMLFMELLEKQLNSEGLEKQKQYLSRIHDQANRLKELIDDLLDVSRIETGKLHLKMEEIKLDELIEDTVEGLRPSAQNHELIIESRQSVLVTADRYRIYQVLVNLLTNAIKYSPKSEKILVSVFKKPNEVLVRVQDFGIGIKKDQQQKIFERLYQVVDPIEKTYPGLGLGLFISKEIIERHGGNIWVESEKGKGSTFSFSLPCSKKK